MNNAFAQDAPEWKMPTNEHFFFPYCGKKTPIILLLFHSLLASF